MHLMCKVLVYSILLSSTIAWSEVVRLDASYFARSSPDFLSENNKIDVLKKGTELEILEKKVLPSGAEALKVKVLSNSNLSKKDVWVYRSNHSHYTSLSSSNPNTQTEAGQKQTDCKDCDRTGNLNNNLRSNGQSLADVSKAISEQQNRVSEKDSHPIDRTINSLVDKVKHYSQSTPVQKVISAAKNNAHARSIGKCYRYVKNALAKGLTPGWYSDMAARSGKDSLKRYGFINLLDHEPYKTKLKSPAEAPKGAVLVYSSGKPCRGTRIKDCGHIEIKLDHEGKPGYASDYYSSKPVTSTRSGSRYKLIGVMIKPLAGTTNNSEDK